MKKIYIVFLALLSSGWISAQNFENDWKGFFSYVSIKAISEGNGKIYAAAENSLFSYDVATQETNTLSTINGLSGETISSLYYSEEFSTLLVGYENGLMDVVVDGEDDIITVVDILEKTAIPPDQKTINDFYEYNGSIYISTEFGISIYDLEALEFGDTYFIGDFGSQINITQTTVLSPYIYASSSNGGVRRAMVDDDNLIDFANWETIFNGNTVGVQSLGQEIYIARADNRIDRFVPGSGFVLAGNTSSAILDFKTIDDLMTVTLSNRMEAYSVGFNLQSVVTNSLPNFDFTLQSGIALDNSFYMGTEEDGMLLVPFGTTTVTQILPDGPILNQPFAMDASAGQLWVSFGDITQTNNPFEPISERGISNLRDDKWTNIPFEDLDLNNDATREATDIVYVTINPNNPNEVWMSSYIGGLLKIEDQTPTNLFTYTNSNLILPQNNPNIGIRVFGSDFDAQGNLWVLQSRIIDGLLKVTGNGQFQQIDLSPVINADTEQALIEVKTSREGFVFFSTAQNGVVGYNPNNGSFGRLSEGLGQGNLPRNNVKAIEFDRQNRLWIGTTKGLRVLFNVAGVFEPGETVDAQEIIILQDGIPQELLFQQTITDIEVDGSNNKWIATATSGVFYLSSNGQETLLRFTKENSPIPSNNVQDITIDPASGRVYFATQNGLVAFEGTSTAPQDDLENVYAFPNPVRPGFTGNVTIDGLTSRANVKITDIEGNLVFETTSQGGSVQWDTSAFGKYKVASGVYMVFISTDDALETKIHKIMVIR